MTDTMYRYEDILVAARLDEHENSIGDSRVEIRLRTFRVLRETDCGVWIDCYGERKFVNLKARKRWACATPTEARESFIARKKRQVGILSARLRAARDALRTMQRADTMFHQ